MLKLCMLLGTMLVSTSAIAQDGQISVEEGERISRIGACHDCHTVGFAASGGQLDPSGALKGSSVGYRGPWGTTYPANLRIVAAGMSEDDWVNYLKTLETLPPMPWFGLQYFRETETRSLYRYIVSLGEPGEPVPSHVPPDQEPTTPYRIMEPLTVPAGTAPPRP